MIFIPLFLALAIGARAQFLSCVLEGPEFPPPQNLEADASVRTTLAALQSTLQSLSSSSNSTLDPSTSFSIEAFSSQSNEPLFQFHHAGSSVKASTDGLKNITRDSIYRIGSVSKLPTVYLFLIEAGDTYFSQPITKFVPELAAAAAAQNSSTTEQNNALETTQWDQITIGALASQLAGIQRDGEDVLSSSSRMSLTLSFRWHRRPLIRWCSLDRLGLSGTEQY